VLLTAGVGLKHRCLALLVVAIQVVGAISKSISEAYKIKSEKDGHPVHITRLSYVSLVLDCCSSLVLIISPVYLLAVVAETPPAIDFLEILAVSGKMVLAACVDASTKIAKAFTWCKDYIAGC